MLLHCLRLFFLESQANDGGDAVEIFGVPDGLEDAS